MFVTLVGILFFPVDAFAWGPVAHLDFAMQLLSGSMAIAPSLLALLKRHKRDFLYGTLAADVILGKNRVASHDHCHSWGVARNLLQEAEKQGEERQAFMLGYISHLGADVVAHNHIVPLMMVTHYKRKGAGHLYWESRCDHRLLKMDPWLQEVWNDLAAHKFPEHDRFLKTMLVPSIFSNGISRQIYTGNLHIQRKGMWRKAMQRVDTRSKLAFTNEQLQKWRNLACHSSAIAVNNPWREKMEELDPVGHNALAGAVALRKSLRRESRAHPNSKHVKELYEEAMRKLETISIHFFELEEYPQPGG